MSLTELFEFNPKKKPTKKEEMLAKVDSYIELANQIWQFINKIFVEVLSFGENIVGYFNNLLQNKPLKQDELAISIKEKLQNGDYRTVNCLYNQKKAEVVEMNTTAIGINSHRVDAQTEQAFGNSDMIILQ